MKLCMAQMSMTENRDENLEKSIRFCLEAADGDLLFFPEIQLTPFFPQYPGRNVDKYVSRIKSREVEVFCQQARENHLFLSPNLFIEEDGRRFDRSLWINADGVVQDSASMVHIYQGDKFFEKDYYTPSQDGFKVYDTPFGKVGIVICFDRHIPESIRTCALMGADLIIIPTANTKEEPLDMFEWEIRVQAMQNSVFIAMCNRVGREDQMDFAGESLIADPFGNLVIKADDQEGLIQADFDLSIASQKRQSMPWFELRRKEFYL
ncbi:MAG: carbon-nitrogen hydrolase family protein [Lachnospiraceae bacterium]|nr:carbon-nitrogen hydrolase family protein [Lachnospiraceae bacterium]